MSGLLWEHNPLSFLFLTVIIGGAIAWATGRGIAQTWRPIWQVVAYVLLLSAVVRFLHYGLLEGTLLSFHYLVVDAAVLMIAGIAGFYVTRSLQMQRQYGWLNR